MRYDFEGELSSIAPKTIKITKLEELPATIDGLDDKVKEVVIFFHHTRIKMEQVVDVKRLVHAKGLKVFYAYNRFAVRGLRAEVLIYVKGE